VGGCQAAEGLNEGESPFIPRTVDAVRLSPGTT
jgi:hypothetical protein